MKALFLVLMLALMLPAHAVAFDGLVITPDCNTTGARETACGGALKQNEWQEIARCNDGHTWSYILEKKSQRKLCKGTNALGGPVEDPCAAFEGNVQSFKKLIDVIKRQDDSPSANTPLNCWDVKTAKKKGSR